MRPLAVFLLFPVLALLSRQEAVAAPPEQVSGAMKFDPVADGLRKYAKETGRAKRIRWLEKLARSGDPRVAVALGDLMWDDPAAPAAEEAAAM